EQIFQGELERHRARSSEPRADDPKPHDRLPSCCRHANADTPMRRGYATGPPWDRSEVSGRADVRHHALEQVQIALAGQPVHPTIDALEDLPSLLTVEEVVDEKADLP